MKVTTEFQPLVLSVSQADQSLLIDQKINGASTGRIYLYSPQQLLQFIHRKFFVEWNGLCTTEVELLTVMANKSQQVVAILFLELHKKYQCIQLFIWGSTYEKIIGKLLLDDDRLYISPCLVTFTTEAGIIVSPLKTARI